MFKTKDRQAGGGNIAVGEALRAAREACGMSYQQVSEDCKLQERFIQAIEAGHTDYLPAHIYFRMFARMYADTLSIDPDQLLGRLYPEAPEPEFGTGLSATVEVSEGGSGRSYDPNDPDEQLAQAVSGPPSRNAQQYSTISPSAPSRPIDRGPSPMTPQYVPDRSAPGGSAFGMTIANVVGSYGKSLKIGSAVTVGAILVFVIVKFGAFNDPHAEDATALANDPQIRSSNSTNSTPSASAALEELGLSDYASAEELQLTIRALSATSVVVVADGDTLFDRKLEAGETLTWKSDYRFRIDIAQRENVELFVAGQKLKPLPSAGGAVNDFEINQLNYQEMLLPSPSGD